MDSLDGSKAGFLDYIKYYLKKINLLRFTVDLNLSSNGKVNRIIYWNRCPAYTLSIIFFIAITVTAIRGTSKIGTTKS